jgi:hypothetical protein
MGLSLGDDLPSADAAEGGAAMAEEAVLTRPPNQTPEQFCLLALILSRSRADGQINHNYQGGPKIVAIWRRGVNKWLYQT